jgi:hypothetical protein
MADRSLAISLPNPPERYDVQDQRETRRAISDAVQRLSNAERTSLAWVDVTQAPYNAKGDGRTNDTFAIQAAIDAVAVEVPTGATGSTDGGGIVFMPEGHYAFSTLTLKSGVRLFGAGQHATKLIPIASGSAPVAAIQLDEGIVDYAALGYFSLLGNGNAGQHGIYLHAVPIEQHGVTQGGLWYPELTNLFISGFDGEQLWLHGGDDSFLGPIQFINMTQVEVECTNVTGHALRMSGEVNQVRMMGTCRFDGPGKGAGGTCVLLERSVDDAGVLNGDISPNTVHFGLTTIQSNTRGITIERAAGVSLYGTHFEELDQGIQVDISALGVLVDHTYCGNVGHDGSGTGFFLRVDSGTCVATNCVFASSSPAVATDTHYIQRFGGHLQLQGDHFDETGMRTSGLTVLLTVSSSTLDCGDHDHVYVDTSATQIDTITSNLPVGRMLVIKAHNGTVTLKSGGNIYFDSGFQWASPFPIIQDSCVVLFRTDLQEEWKIVAGLPNGSWNYTRPFGCNGATPTTSHGVPAGSLGTLVGVCALADAMRAALVNNGICV